MSLAIKSMTKKKKSFLLLIFAAAVLVVGGGVTAYWLLVRRQILQPDIQVSTQLVPQNAFFTASISTESKQWQQLLKYGTTESRQVLEKQLAELQENLLTANGYNYQQDIKPWLGEDVTLAYFSPRDLSPAVLSNDQSVFPSLIVLPIDKLTQAMELFKKAKSQSGKQWVERTYRGIQVYETNKSNSQKYSVAVLGRFLVVSENPKIIDRAIDTYKGAISVASKAGYQDAIAEIKADQSFAQLYINLPGFLAAVASDAQEQPEKTKPLKQDIVTTVTLAPEGISFEGISWVKPRSTVNTSNQNSGSFLPRRMPASTLAIISGGNIRQFWQYYTEQGALNTLMPISPDNFQAGLKTTLGLDWEKDLLSWMEGEFALALIPMSAEQLALEDNPYSAPLGAGIALMVKVSDRSSAQATLQQLDDLITNSYQLPVVETQVNGQPMVSWTATLGGVNATHGWLEGNVVFFTLGAPIASELVPQPQKTLIQAPLFQNTVPTKPNPNTGQFFLDVERTLNSSNLNLAQLPTEQETLAKAINTIGLTVAKIDPNRTRFQLFVQLKKEPQPSKATETKKGDNQQKP
ncbi:hypothetical protein BJP34_21200 [Moorena producens PAL-8-15-08-1]|uniref:Uncharacterized protein n=2 Tax=Moorena TaxID=1155738 RepID=A0A1D8TVC9_9CYAN|nr:hypothetical protein BJP34_21200 [Moorena producens PAL-8-15-08-1]